MKFRLFRQYLSAFFLNVACIALFLGIIPLLGPCDEGLVAKAIYLPKDCPDYLKDSVRPQDIMIEVDPNDPRISHEWIYEVLLKAPKDSQNEIFDYYEIHPVLR